jgi:hypothetical protein
MANYEFRRDETVTALDAGFRATASQRSHHEDVEAVDVGIQGFGLAIRHDEVVTVVDGLAYQGGKAFRSNETVTVVDGTVVVADYERRSDEVVEAVVVERAWRGLYRSHHDTVGVIDAGTGFKQYWMRSDEVVTAVDAVAEYVSVAYERRSDEVVTAVDTVRVSLRQKPGEGLTLRPASGGFYDDWSVHPVTNEAWQSLLTDDGDTSYVYISTEPGDAFTVGIDPLLLPVSSPHRITGLMVHMILKGSGAVLQPRFYLHERTYDGDEFSPPGATYWSYWTWWPINVFGGYPWTSSDLLDLEVGIVNAGTAAAYVTYLQVYVATEPTPLRLPLLNANGSYDQWDRLPEDSSPYDILRLDDGSRSYVQTSDAGDKETIRSADEEMWLPEQFRIDKVNLTFRAMGNGSLMPLVREASQDFSGPYGDWEVELDPEAWQTYQVPFYGRPGFASAMSRWELPNVLAADWGFEKVDSGEAQVSHEKLEIFASLVPEAETRLLPTDDGVWQEWVIQAPNTGESAYEDVNTFLADDTSYLRADATVRPKLSTFEIVSTLEANAYGARWRARFRREPAYTGTIRFAPLLVESATGDLYVGRPFDSTSDEWIEALFDFWVNPFDGKPWSETAFQQIEVGAILLEGKADLSWCVLEVGSVPPREHHVDATEFDFTTTGRANVARCTTDDLVWTIDRYRVGRGGYQRDNPAVVHPVEPADDTLEDPLYLGKVIRSHTDGFNAYYWLAIPPEAFSDPIGEIMLMARVVSSSDPSDVVGSYFPMAVGHFPAGFHTLRSIRVIRVKLHYGPLGAFVSDEVVTAFDSVTVEVNYERRRDEVVTAVDTVRQVDNYRPRSEETVTAVDDTTVEMGYNRSAAETVSAVDGLSTSQGFLASEDEVVTVIDGTTVVADYERAEDEVVSAVDGTSRVATHERSEEETVSAVDGGSANAAFERSEAETVSAVDATSANAAFERSEAETVTAADGSSIGMAFERRSDETVTATDGVTVTTA